MLIAIFLYEEIHIFYIMTTPYKFYLSIYKVLLKE